MSAKPVSNKYITEREAELWGDEAKVAERVVQFFELLIKVRQAAGAGVEPQKIIDALLLIDPDQLAATDLWLTRFLWDRFRSEKDTIARRKQAAEAAASKGCPYSQAQYDSAVASIGTAPKRLAPALGVTRKTLAKHRRPLS